MSLTKAQFERYASQGFNRIPVTHEVLADLDTPLSTYLKLARGPYSYLLESVHGGEKWGRYSIIGLPARLTFSVRGNEVVENESGRATTRADVEDPLNALRDLKARFRVPEVPGLPRFTGGLVGYFGYDTVRHIEPHLGACTRDDPIGTPDILVVVSDEVVVFDNLTGRLHVVHHADPGAPDAWSRAQERLEELVARLAEPVPPIAVRPQARDVRESDFVSCFEREDFEEAVERCREYIYNGDIMQVVLSQRLSVPFEAGPLDLYRALRTLNPSPYMYYMDMADFYVVGSSPEILARLEGDTVTVRPIAGTRPRGADEEADRRLERELMADPKELAEHLMLVDLGRNDVGRVARTGSVHLTEKMIIERYSHVMHIVSNVTGRLREGLDAIDVLRATFPAGTVSGAPKVRAMEIIDELEPVKRGVYAGAVGYIGWNGNMDTAIAIRTAVIRDKVLSIQVGAGIVADSVPSREWEETMNKGRAVFRAVAMAAAGLNAH
jgi:anthranilate synthase component 1